ncbi:glutaredoxin [Yamadazyma tenuis]|uniref:Monothiol glutaredoxin-3 n=1 Tax=Candida tenuis (strain ATCC 10573 / BCRC 21748 / CBS 615 / JCM 9827 / NBRC 10315 / NRRL Y-1498 / VKM Y-70) TaxID=590646 RepID=G3AYZ8_CANTC|nr:monothiol glutaredoxin-3 [Yamadazyma tenuis ATCC 10573]XP_006684838.1 uncharacterized protein CANTEDRAFT_112844 [Yamadazyma tenuis ATCC 10573]EGV66263.1 monothiol glutaredoxin-3 [Yamadazyma tenuis ATCC 10573]EGV66264.1 hypothetical protein CANTEDRAFT_112844 [Yamadazyma tenuis ATCC 10573]WEJ95694.1 glutaredoxin [Yamadazyma tenuis]
MPVTEINSEDQFTTLSKTKDTLISLYFHTEWAEPCKTMNSIYSTLSDTPDNKEVLFLSINADNQSDISDLFDVSAVPYFILIKDSTILKELSGADPKEFIGTLNELRGTTSTAATTASPTQPALEEAPKSQEDESPEALNARLEKLTKAAPVMLFMKGSPSSPQCGFSRQLVAILREHEVRFGFFDILKDDSVRQGLKAFSDWPTFPQLYVGGEFQGGLDIIKESIEDDPDFFKHAIEA